MELVYPGIWPSITLLGILATLAGSSLLAFTRTNLFREKLEKDLREQFGSKASYGIEIIEDGGELTSDLRGFDELSCFLTISGVIHSLNLPIEPGDEIQKIEKGDSKMWGVCVNITDDSGVLHENATTTSDINEKIDSMIEKRLNEKYDTVTRYSWEIVAVGFLIQLVSHFARHFIRF